MTSVNSSALPLLVNPYLPETVSSPPIALKAKKAIHPCFTSDCPRLGKRFYHPDHPKDVTKKICEICHHLLMDKNKTWDHCAWCPATRSIPWRKIKQLPKEPIVCDPCYRNGWLSIRKPFTELLTKMPEDQLSLSSYSKAEQQALLKKTRKKQNNNTKKIEKRKSQKRPAEQNPNLQIDPPPAKTRQSPSLPDSPVSQTAEHLAWNGSLNDLPSPDKLAALQAAVDQFISDDYWNQPPSVDGQASPNELFAPNFG